MLTAETFRDAVAALDSAARSDGRQIEALLGAQFPGERFEAAVDKRDVKVFWRPRGVEIVITAAVPR